MKINYFLVGVLLTSYSTLVTSQVDGSFWWTNKDLLRKASESRNNKKVEFKNEEEIKSTTEESVKDMDCTCVSQCKCQVVLPTTDNSPRHLCPGTDQVCCQTIKLPLPWKCFELELQFNATTMTHANEINTPIPTTTPTMTTTENPRDSFVYPVDEIIDPNSFVLSLAIRDRSHRFNRICGAALIGKTMAVTAQHCVRGSRLANDFMITTLDGQRRIITEVIRHPQYYSGGLYNDLAVLKWKDEIRTNDQVEVVDLPEKNLIYEKCEMLGIGLTNTIISKPVQLLSHDDCEHQIQSSKWGPRFKLHKNFTCIETNFERSCIPSQDNAIDGNPLICYDRIGQLPALIGVMSWYSCNRHPDVLVDIRKNVDWISQVIP